MITVTSRNLQWRVSEPPPPLSARQAGRTIAVLQLDVLRGQGAAVGFCLEEEERRPLGRQCVDIVFGYFEHCYLRQ